MNRRIWDVISGKQISLVRKLCLGMQVFGKLCFPIPLAAFPLRGLNQVQQSCEDKCVPKQCLGTREAGTVAQTGRGLYFGATELRRQVRSQTEFGHERGTEFGHERGCRLPVCATTPEFNA